MAGVCAVVVTFNRERLVAECLDALERQTRPIDRVIVVDNGSTDRTAELLRDRRVEVVRLERNAGSSGGFAAGVEAARDGCDWLWLMDDDAEPLPDALERLLELDGDAAALCPAVVAPDGTIDIKHRGGFRRRPRYLPRERYVPGAELGFFTWVGPLLRADAVRAAGPPKADLFIWADDYEYSFRIRQQGRIVLVPDARVVHKEVGQAHTNRRSRFWNRLTGWDMDPAPIESFWRNLCGIRNYIWLKRRHERQGPVSAAGTAAQFMLKSLLYDERPLGRMKWIARAAVDGRRGRFDRFRGGM